MNSGLLLCAFCWYAIGIPFLLSPYFPFMSTQFVLTLPIWPLGHFLPEEIKDEKERRRKGMLDEILDDKH